jgi:hypothetical protein
MLVLPAGRTAAAAIKSAWLATDSCARLDRAAVEQACALAAVGASSLALSLAGPAPLARVLLAHGAVALAAAIAIALALRARRAAISSSVTARVFASLAASRALQLAQVALVARALSLHALPAARAFGALLVGASLGDVVPAQLGATDAALSLSAGAIGATPGACAAIAVAVHVAQLAVLAAAGATALASTSRPRCATA